MYILITNHRCDFLVSLPLAMKTHIVIFLIILMVRIQPTPQNKGASPNHGLFLGTETWHNWKSRRKSCSKKFQTRIPPIGPIGKTKLLAAGNRSFRFLSTNFHSSALQGMFCCHGLPEGPWASNDAPWLFHQTEIERLVSTLMGRSPKLLLGSAFQYLESANHLQTGAIFMVFRFWRKTHDFP